MPAMLVWHRNMDSVGDSVYRKVCPFCTVGIFLVSRNRETMQLQELDRCINCGQLVQYADIEEMREKYG